MKHLSIILAILITIIGCSASESVDFPDKNLADAIREALEIRPDAPIPVKKLQELNRLQAINAEISSLSGLEHAKNLTNLALPENQISNLAPLTGLTQLVGLNLSKNNIRDIQPLSKLIQLRRLILSYNQITDISSLSHLKVVNYLAFDENSVNDISKLSSLIKLQYVSLNHNNITDISSLAQLRQLLGLQIEHNKVEDISPLSWSSELFDLKLAHNRIRDISPLENIKKLRLLHIKGNPIEDHSPIGSLFLSQPDMVLDIEIPNHPYQDAHRIGLPLEAKFRLGKGEIKTMQYSPDGSKLAVGSSIGAWVYDVNSGQGIPVQVRIAKEITALAFTSDGRTLATSGYNTPIELWDTETGKRISIFQRPADVLVVGTISGLVYQPGSQLAFSNDDRTLIGLRSDSFIGVLTIWDVPSVSLYSLNYGIERKGIGHLSFDQNTVAVGLSDGKISIWDLKIEDRIPSLNRDKLLKGHNRLFLGESISNLFKKKKYHQKKDQSIRAIALSPDSKTLVSAGTHNSIRILDLTKGSDHVIYEDLKYWISAMDFSNDGNTVAIGMGNTVRLWDIPSNSERASLEGHTGGVNSVVYSPDGETLASGGNDGTIRFWDVNTGKELNLINGGYTYSVERVQFSKDNTILLSSLEGGNNKGWDLNTGIELPYDSIKNIETFPAKSVHNVVDRIHPKMKDIISFSEIQMFSPDGKLYITVNYGDPQIRIWDFFNPEDEILILTKGHTAPLKTLAFSHNGKTLASAGEDGTILLWDWDKIAANVKTDDR